MSLNITLTINPYYILHQSKNPANTKCSLCTVLPLLLVFVKRPHELLLVVPLLAGHVVPAGHHLVVELETKVHPKVRNLMGLLLVESKGRSAIRHYAYQPVRLL